MGGKVPDEIRYENRENNKDMSDKTLVKLNVGARSVRKVEVNVHEPGTKLKWFFRCSSGDIDFSIIKDGVYVWPRYRITTEFVPEFGQIECEESGTYEIEFDNGHGKVWSKDLKYAVHVE
uniref:GOLD domain-containing protein n=1 Tax=Steinernema glaseri TaxID=37863 RepID=A0A1I7YNF3_9BILA